MTLDPWLGREYGLDDEPEGSISIDPDKHVAIRCGALEEMTFIDHGHADGVFAASLDCDVTTVSVEQIRVGDREHCERVVQRSATQSAAVVACDVGLREEVEESGENLGELSGKASSLLNSLRRYLELMGDVEPGHHERSGRSGVGCWVERVEHDRSSFRVAPDVVLGSRRPVSKAAASHDRHPGEPAGEVGCLAKREADIGQRSGGDEPEAFFSSARLDDEFNGIGSIERGDRVGQVGTVKPRFPMDEAGIAGRSDERSSAAAMYRCVEPDEVAHDESVVRCADKRNVAGNGRDAADVREMCGRDNRDGVVVAGIAIKDDPRSCGGRGGLGRGHDAEHARPSCTLENMEADRIPWHRRCRAALFAGTLLLAACSSSDAEPGVADSTSSDEATDPVDGDPFTEGQPVDDVPVDVEAVVESIPPVAEEGVPGIDSDDAFCRSWSAYAGSVQALSVAWGLQQRVDAARLEVAATNVLSEAVAGMAEHLPSELESNRSALTVDVPGPFLRRAQRARGFLVIAGADNAQIVELGEAWIDAIVAAGLDADDVSIVVPAGSEALLELAAAQMSDELPSVVEDPTLDTTAFDISPSLDYIFENCPDRGTLAGNDVTSAGGA